MTPHRVHLLEMRATRPGATDERACHALLDGIEATIAERGEPDATARHLAEMRAGREVQGG